MGYVVTTSRIDSLNRRKTLSESLASARLLFCGKGDGVNNHHGDRNGGHLIGYGGLISVPVAQKVSVATKRDD